MARKFNIQIVPSSNGLVSGNMSVPITSPVTDMSNTESFSVQAVWTGSPVGTIKLQVSTNGTTFVDVPDSVTPVSGTGNAIWDGYTGTGCDKIQVVYTPSSGSGTLSAWISGKGLPD